ncbi:MAG: hypothetical protein AAFV53_23455 [Myxococcota bacterium]
MQWIKVLLLFFGLTGATAGSWMMAARGVGLSDDLRQQASVRAGSVGGGRVIVGGGLHGGK